MSTDTAPDTALSQRPIGSTIRLTDGELTEAAELIENGDSDLICDEVILTLIGEAHAAREARLQIEAKLRGHRGSSTRNLPNGQYKNPVREGYDRGLTEALALLGVDAKEKNPDA